MFPRKPFQFVAKVLGFKIEITEGEFKELVSPKLRLFMSVDVVGSTAFKHRSEKTDAQGWLDFFTSFYTEFPDYLINAQGEILKEERREEADLSCAYLWKALGDELIFVAELTHKTQAPLHLKAFRRAISKAVTSFVHGSNPLDIHFKATAWIAGFPVGNAAIPTEENSTSIPYDFIGPSIDIGFRLAQIATPRRFSVSIELAYLILKANADLKLYYEGKQPLPGVLNERGYPLVWLDNYAGLQQGERHSEHIVTAKEDLLTEKKGADANKLMEFCQAYIDEIGAPLMIPFIQDDGDLPAPTSYEKDCKIVEDRLRRVFNVRADSNVENSKNNSSIPQLEKWIKEESDN